MVSSPLSPWHYEKLGSPVNLATDPMIMLPYSLPMKFFQRLHNVYNYYFTVYNFNKYAHLQNTYVEKYFGPGYPSAEDLQKDISLVLVNYDQSLNGVRPFAPMILPVGGLHISDTDEPLVEVRMMSRFLLRLINQD